MKLAMASLVLGAAAQLAMGQMYVPPPESAGGWRWCKTADEVRSIGGMDPDKLQLIKVLSLADVLATLEERTRKEQIARGEDTDEGEESYREALGKLLNVLGLELCKLSEVCVVSKILYLGDISEAISRTPKMMLERRPHVLPTRSFR